jgi:hypothetical protein
MRTEHSKEYVLLLAYFWWNNTIDMPISHGSTWADVMGSQIPRLKTYWPMTACQAHWPGVTLRNRIQKRDKVEFRSTSPPARIGRKAGGEEPEMGACVILKLHRLCHGTIKCIIFKYIDSWGSLKPTQLPAVLIECDFNGHLMKHGMRLLWDRPYALATSYELRCAMKSHSLLDTLHFCCCIQVWNGTKSFDPNNLLCREKQKWSVSMVWHGGRSW